MLVRAFVALCGLLAASAAMAQTQVPTLCSKTEKEVEASAECVRWWFGCYYPNLNFSKGRGDIRDPRFADLPLEAKQKIMLQTTFNKTEKTCAKFNYVEAEAAMRDKLQQIRK